MPGVVEQRPEQIAAGSILSVRLIHVAHQVMSLVPQQVGNRQHGELTLSFLEAGIFPQQQRFDEVGHAAITGARLRLHELGNVGPESHGECVAHRDPQGRRLEITVPTSPVSLFMVRSGAMFVSAHCRVILSRRAATAIVTRELATMPHCLTLIVTGVSRCLRWFVTGRVQVRGATGGEADQHGDVVGIVGGGQRTVSGRDKGGAVAHPR